MLNDVQAALKTVDSSVYFVEAIDRDRSLPWDYIVFARRALRKNSDYTDSVLVLIVREHYIPDGLPEKVIAAMQALPGVRLAPNTDFAYEYMTKDNTSDIIETLELEFVRPRRACDS